MKRLRRLLSIIVVSGLLALALCGMPRFSSAASAADVPPYSLADVMAGMRIKSPMENGTYLGSLVTLNVGASFQVIAWPSDADRRIPYEDIELLYSVDDGEWQTIPLVSAREWGFPSPNGYYFDTVHCNYTVTLPPLSEGWHFVQVNFEPELRLGGRQWSNFSSHQTQSIHFKTINTTGLSVLFPQNRTYGFDEVPFIFEVDEPSAHVSYSLDNQKNVTQENTGLIRLTDGSHNLTVYAKDDFGTVVDSVAVNFSVDSLQTETPSVNAWIAIATITVTVGVLGVLVYLKKSRNQGKWTR